ncbi:MAG: restriction endonuclease subunit S [Elusimicrobia bacterium]|nr:restriction endonuclease subunit S [Elusimicrobiota bacterium]
MKTANWKRVPFNKAVWVNPPTALVRGETYPFVDMQALNPSSREVGPSEYRTFTGGGSRFFTGDTLMARITPCLENGKIAQFRGPTPEAVAHGSTEFIVIRGRDGMTDNNFAYYLTRSEIVRSFAIAQMTGTSGRQRVPTEALSHLQVALPPLDDQRMISRILGSLDDKIELNRRMNETLEGIAQALFKNWIADVIESKLPEGWRKGKLEELVSINKEIVTPSNFPKETFDYYSIPAFDEGRLPKPEMGDQIQSNKFVVPLNAVLLSKLNPRIPRVWLPSVYAKRRSICSTEFLVALPKPHISREYLFGLFTSRAFFEVFATLVTGTSGSHQRVKPDYLVAMDVIIPPQNLMDRFTKMTHPLYEKIVQNLEESRILAAIRDTLLPKLISDELRIPNAKRIIGEHP